MRQNRGYEKALKKLRAEAQKQGKAMRKVKVAAPRLPMNEAQRQYVEGELRHMQDVLPETEYRRYEREMQKEISRLVKTQRGG